MLNGPEKAKVETSVKLEPLWDGLQGLQALKSEPLLSGLGGHSTQAFDELNFIASRANRRGSLPPAPPAWALLSGGDDDFGAFLRAVPREEEEIVQQIEHGMMAAGRAVADKQGAPLFGHRLHKRSRSFSDIDCYASSAADLGGWCGDAANNATAAAAAAAAAVSATVSSSATAGAVAPGSNRKAKQAEHDAELPTLLAAMHQRGSRPGRRGRCGSGDSIVSDTAVPCLSDDEEQPICFERIGDLGADGGSALDLLLQQEQQQQEQQQQEQQQQQQQQQRVPCTPQDRKKPAPHKQTAQQRAAAMRLHGSRGGGGGGGAGGNSGSNSNKRHRRCLSDDAVVRRIACRGGGGGGGGNSSIGGGPRAAAGAAAAKPGRTASPAGSTAPLPTPVFTAEYCTARRAARIAARRAATGYVPPPEPPAVPFNNTVDSWREALERQARALRIGGDGGAQGGHHQGSTLPPSPAGSSSTAGSAHSRNSSLSEGGGGPLPHLALGAAAAGGSSGDGSDGVVKRGPRGQYLCTRCGMPKAGHVCNLVMGRSIHTQVDLAVTRHGQDGAAQNPGCRLLLPRPRPAASMVQHHQVLLMQQQQQQQQQQLAAAAAQQLAAAAPVRAMA